MSIPVQGPENQAVRDLGQGLISLLDQLLQYSFTVVSDISDSGALDMSSNDRFSLDVASTHH